MDLSNSSFLNLLLIMIILYIFFNLLKFIGKGVLIILITLLVIIYIFGGKNIQKKLDSWTINIEKKVLKINKTILKKTDKKIIKRNNVLETYQKFSKEIKNKTINLTDDFKKLNN